MTFDRRRFLGAAALGLGGAVLGRSVPEVRAADEGKSTKTRTRVVQVRNRYLNLPVKTGAPVRRVNMLVAGRTVRDFNIELADDAPDWWAFMDLTPFKGKAITLAVQELPEGSKALESIRQSDRIVGHETLYREALRPQFRFSTRRGWLNDPHVIFYQGEYHLFYQHNPYGWSWGNGHWGHAVSTDLVHWKELTIALYPDEGCIMQSGSIVVDWKDTAGFQTGKEKALVAMFTTRGRMVLGEEGLIHENDIPATQGLAYSNDRGRTWTKYANNPVIPHIIGGNRDPRVFWYEPGKKWVMSLYMDKSDFSLFSSVDLKKWQKLSDLKLPGDSECPELFEVAVDGDRNNTRWVFYGASGLYFIGKFNGEAFTPESGPHALQSGNCWYAPQNFSDIPASDGRHILIPWGPVRSPNRKSLFEGMPFNQSMGIPVELTLHTTDEGLRVFSNPVRELASLRAKAHTIKPQVLREGHNPLASVKGELFDLTTEIAPGNATEVVFDLRGVPVVYDARKQELRCGDNKAPLKPVDGKIQLRMLVDRTAIDIFGNKGRLYMPMGVSIAADNSSLAVSAKGDGARIDSLEIHELKSAWGTQLG